MSVTPSPLSTGLAGLALALGLLAAAPASAAEPAYEFVPSPKEGQFYLYRINRETGEMGFCWFDGKSSESGTIVCGGPGAGGGPQAPGDYRLIAAPNSGQSAVFRVNTLTGEASVCYWNGGVVCTPAK